MIAEDYAAAERVLADGRDELGAMGERAVLSCILVQLAEIACAHGDLDEALRLTEETEAIADADDIAAQAPWRATRAKVLAKRGLFVAARQLASQAVTSQRLLPKSRCWPTSWWPGRRSPGHPTPHWPRARRWSLVFFHRDDGLDAAAAKTGAVGARCAVRSGRPAT